jgi:ATP-dependent helicase/nuclease subunit B
MAAKVSVLAGPVRSGKTVSLLARYRQILSDAADGNASGAAVWIAPTKYAAADIRERLIADGLAGCFRPGVYTFDQFAQALLAASDEPPRYVGRLLKRQLIQRLLDEANEAKRLQYFAPIADTAGLVDLVDGVISDLKRQQVGPDKFAQLIESVAPSEKNREIAWLYGEYQRLLDRHNMHDIEGRFWSVGKLLRETPPERWEPFANVRQMVVDGFTDFTQSQQEVLQLLATRGAHLEELTITLPLEEGKEREDLFYKPQHTLEQLKKRLPKLVTRWQAREKVADWPGLSHVEQYLFCNPRDVKPATDASRIEIIAAAGQKAEIEAVARRIKTLLVQGDEERNNGPVQPGKIAVVFRSVEPVSSLVEEVFGEYGIPFSIDAPPKLNRSPMLQTLLSCLRLQGGDWPFRQLLAVLANNYFQPDWPEWHGGGAAVSSSASAAVEWAIRQIQIPKGRETLLTSLKWRAKADEAAADSETESEPVDDVDLRRKREHRRRYGVALAVLSRLEKTLPAAGGAKPLSDWLGVVEGVVRGLSLLRNTEQGEASRAVAVDPSLSRYDRQAWRQLASVLSAGDQLEKWLEIEPAKLTLSQFIDRLQDILSVEQLPIERDEAGRVRVLSAQSVRAITVPYLFVAGVAEKVFPPPARDDRVYTDAEYYDLNRAGLHFVDGRARSCEEMLLFYEVITRATQRLTLSYPALDAMAQPLLPSPYLTELERCCGEGQIARDDKVSLSPVPQHPNPFSPVERRIKAVAELVEGDSGRLARLISGKNGNIVPALRTIAARREREFGPYEGILSGAAALRQLQDRFGPQHCWSVSRLEEYGYCPFQFFAKSILGLEELPDLGLETDFGRRGQLAHEAFATLHRRLNSAGTARSPVEIGEGYSKLASETVEFLGEQIAKGSPLEIALRTVDLRLISQWLEAYIGQHADYDKAIAALSEASRNNPLRPAHFEISFGLKPRTNEELDPLSTETPFELICDGETVRFSGRIDRIDIGMVGGEVVFNVLDYKTGASKGFKARSLASGVHLQLPLYALAVKELLMVDRRALPWRVGYWFVKEKGFDDHGLPQFFEKAEIGLRETEDWQTLRGTLQSRVASLVRGIRGGSFPVFSGDKECSKLCAYSTVCRIGQIRSLNKVWPAGELNLVESNSAAPVGANHP